MNYLEMQEKTELILRNYDDIEAEEVQWLWYPYIPFGKLTILQGDPGCGKTMVALDLAARLSSGTPMPFTDKIFRPIDIIYQTAEDGPEDTIKPRLIAAGADCSRIVLIEEKGSPVSFGDSRLEEAIKTTQAKLLILDPLSAFI